MVKILNSTLSIPVQIFLKNPPPWNIGPQGLMGDQYCITEMSNPE